MTAQPTARDALRQRIAFELHAAGGPFVNADAGTLADALLPLVDAHAAEVTAAAYRAAADEIQTTQTATNAAAIADHGDLYDTEQHTRTAVDHITSQLRARADQMEQPHA